MITVLLGMSGTGKSTIEEAIIKKHSSSINRVVSNTTRPKRTYEEDGVHYNFLSDEEFEKGIINGEYIEHAEFNGWYYGINKNNIDLKSKHYICVTNPQGYYALKSLYKDEVIGILIYTPENQRYERYMGRDFKASPKEWERRLKTDYADFDEIIHDKCVHKVDNSNGAFESAISSIENIIFPTSATRTISIKGLYNEAKVYTDNVEREAISQIIQLCNQQFTKDSKIVIQPDCHAGKGCTIGTTMTLSDKVVPNLVGVDIGCGVVVYKLKTKTIPVAILDDVIKKKIPSGFNIRDNEHTMFASRCDIAKLRCLESVDIQRAYRSIGTLGGGNHFVELSRDSKGCLYLIIHSGSRNLGKQVADYYQAVATNYHREKHQKETKAIIEECKKLGTAYHINLLLEDKNIHRIPDALAYLEGEDFDNYMHDMKIVQRYAELNREAIGYEIIKHMGLDVESYFHTIHNYIDTRNMILRKGAVSALDGEMLLIPINMSDGSLLCKGKGNEAWNYSAPHGAGRVLSRSKAKELITMDEFKESMDGIYTSSIHQSTLDEAPQAYKNIDDIMSRIGDTADVLEILKPVYNYKAH